MISTHNFFHPSATIDMKGSLVLFTAKSGEPYESMKVRAYPSDTIHMIGSGTDLNLVNPGAGQIMLAYNELHAIAGLQRLDAQASDGVKFIVC